MSAIISSELQYSSFTAALSYVFSNEMIFDIDVFGPSMKLWILGHANCSLIISRITIGPGGLQSSSLRSCWSQIASWVALASAMYSASAVERATHDCFLLLQLMAALLIRKTYPDFQPNLHLHSRCIPLSRPFRCRVNPCPGFHSDSA